MPERTRWRGDTFPEIEVPSQREIHLVSACVECREEFLARRALIERLSSGINRRQPFGARDAHLRLGFQDSRGRNANIVVLLEGQCGSDLEAACLETPPTIFGRRAIPPQAGGASCGMVPRYVAGTFALGSLIVRPHSAARSKEHNQGKSNKSSHVSPPPMGSAAEPKD